MDAYTGEIRLFAGNFPPMDWAYCDGQLLQVNQYPALYSLIGNIYGGTANVNFNLPDLRGKVPMGAGIGPGLSARTLGVAYGAASVSVTPSQMPAHTHAIQGKAAAGATATNDPTGHTWTNQGMSCKIYGPAPNVTMNPQAVDQMAGGSQPHNNVQPCVAIHYIICLNGIYPDFA
jgi:microcystin-dependent protein